MKMLNLTLRFIEEIICTCGSKLYVSRAERGWNGGENHQQMSLLKFWFSTFISNHRIYSLRQQYFLIRRFEGLRKKLLSG